MITLKQWLSELTQMNDDEMNFIQEITETISVKANEIIVKQGQVSNRIGFLQSGATRSFYTDTQGDEKTVNFTFEGQPLILVGSFINQTPSSVTAVTLEPSTIIWTDHKNYNLFINKFPRYSKVFIDALANWMQLNSKRLEYMKQTSAKSKYELMCQIDPEINKRVPLKYVASYLGITQETLSRVRANK